MLETWMLVMAVVVAVWWYSRRRYSYWSSMGVPSPPTLPLVGHMYGIFTMKSLWTNLDLLYKNYGESGFCGTYEFFRPILMVCDPDASKQILVKNFDHFTDRRAFGNGNIMSKMLSNMGGEEWKVLRSIMSPTFSSGKMRKMFLLVCKTADTLIASCLQDSAKDPSLDMKDKFGRFTMDTIASCAFGIEYNLITKEKTLFIQKAEAFFVLNFLKIFNILFVPLFPKLSTALGMTGDPPEVEFFREVVVETIKARHSGHQRGDFLDLMLEVRATDSDSPTSPKHVLTDESVVAQCVLFLIAGYDTTASTLAFSSYLLAKNPEEQRRLRQELQELVEEEEGELSYQGVMEAKLLDACVMETLRLYPPAIATDRKCTKPYKIPGTEITVRVGDIVQFPIWSLHHDPRYWPEPEQFRPDRFMPENKANIRSFTYMPFGMGPRNCLAMRFALMEVKVALAKLVLAADLQLAPGHEDMVLDAWTFLLRPKHGNKLLVIPLKEE